MIRLGVNIDHVATVRNARGGTHPCPVRAALAAMEAGADGITAHLREDRRHIRDHDIERLRTEVSLPLNLEMAMTPEMHGIAMRIKPHAVCIVPEKREELTTEGGLDAVRLEQQLAPFVRSLQDNGSRVSLFIAPDTTQIDAAHRIGARAVELHTGRYAEYFEAGDQEKTMLARELAALEAAATLAHGYGIEVHAGHGLTYNNVPEIASIPHIRELNIGHFIIGESIFCGIGQAILQFRQIINDSQEKLTKFY